MDFSEVKLMLFFEVKLIIIKSWSISRPILNEFKPKQVYFNYSLYLFNFGLISTYFCPISIDVIVI